MSYEMALAEYEVVRTELFQFFNDWTERLTSSINILLSLLGEMEPDSGAGLPFAGKLGILCSGFRQRVPWMTLCDITLFHLMDQPDPVRLQALPQDKLANDGEFMKLACVPAEA